MGILAGKWSSHGVLQRMNSNSFKSILSNEWLTLITRLIMAGVFIFAAWDKFINPGDFAISIVSYKILPSSLINITAILLSALELVIGIALLVGIFPRGSAFIMTLLMLGFIGAFAIAMINGVNIGDCGCFSSTHPIEDSAKGASYTYIYLLRDAGFLVMLLQILIFGKHKFALQNLISKK
jgi:uncharacterized membrane protein YphA (DoxX/SURF4 family)